MTKVSVLKKAGILKEANIPQFLKETQTLISFVTGKPFSSIIGNNEIELDSQSVKKLDNLLKRRANREPLQYILGYCWFWESKFKVTKDVLIPRPETEHIIEEVLKHYDKSFEGKVIDCCTGSGCVGLSIAYEFPNSSVVLTDISIKALNIAKENSVNLECKDTFFLNCNMLSGIKNNSVDLLLANPPYIGLEEKESLQTEVADFEPAMALFAKEQGLGLIKPLLDTGKDVLKKNGYLIFEFGINQHSEILNYVKKNLKDDFDSCYTVKDLAGIERIGVFRKC